MTDPRVLAVERWARSQRDVVSAAQADLVGLPRPWPQRLVTRGRWVRLLRGVFWTRPEGPPPDDLLLLAARLFAGWGHEPFGVLVGRSAARAWGLPDTRVGWRPEVALPVRTRRRQPRGLRYRWDDLPSSEITCHRGFVCTVPLRTLRDVAAECRFDDALAMADAALREGLATPTDLQTIGTGAGLSVLRHANSRAESPLESRVRAELLLAGLPAPSIQHDIRDDTGRFLARVDFAWPGRRLVVEADGASVHASAAALRDDLRRQNALVGARWTLLRFTWTDLGAIAPRVAAALRALPLRSA